MARIQQSIEINVPVQIVYNQLTQFEDYPSFMQDVEEVRQSDDTHLHWSTRMADRNMEWDAEITEQLPDRCIAWRNLSGPQNVSRLELQPVEQERVRVTLTMDCEPSQIFPTQVGDSEAVMAQRVEEDLVRFKKFIEKRGSETGAWRGEVHNAQVTTRDRDAKRSGGAGQVKQTSSYAAGSEGWDGTEAPSEPMMSAAQSATQGSAMPSKNQQHSSSATQSSGLQANKTTQSDASLSRSSSDEAEQGRFSVAEEVNFDQQSDQARRVGQMPQDAAGMSGSKPSDAMAKAAQSGQPNQPNAKEKADLGQALDNAVPPSEE